MKLYRFEKPEMIPRLVMVSMSKLWLCTPSEFSDVLDCRLRLVRREDEIFSKKAIVKAVNLLYHDAETREKYPFPGMASFLIELLKESHFSEQEVLDSLSALTAIVRQKVDFPYVSTSIANIVRSRTGVCCFFGDIPLSMPMWSIYGAGHRGFCVEYEVDMSRTTDIYKVSYVSDLPTVTVEELLFCPMATWQRLVTSKAQDWTYENEYRLVRLGELDGEGKRLDLPPWIKPISIISGYKMDAKFQGYIDQVAAKLNIKHVKASLVDTRLKIDLG